MSDKVGNIIFKQIKKMDPMAFNAWGAKDLALVSSNGGGLQFKTSGMVKWKGFVLITLNGRDLYDIEFFKMRGAKRNVTKNVTDVYVDDLINQIDAVVG